MLEEPAVCYKDSIDGDPSPIQTLSFATLPFVSERAGEIECDNP